MLILHTYSGHFGEPSGSPFCVKAMCLLHMSGLDWRPDYIDDPRKAPKQKLPVLIDGDQQIPDSDLIREYLEAKTQKDFDAGLDERQRAVSRSLIRMVEEHLYFAVLSDRWMDDANWQVIKGKYFASMPRLLAGIIPPMVRKQVVAQARGQGMGRYSIEERVQRVAKDLQAIETLLGDQAYLFGDQPSAADASVTPMLRAAMVTPVETPLSRTAKANQRLVEYTERARLAIYPKDLAGADNMAR